MAKGSSVKQPLAGVIGLSVQFLHRSWVPIWISTLELIRKQRLISQRLNQLGSAFESGRNVSAEMSTMFGLKTFLAGLFLGSVLSLLAMQVHVINTNDGLIVLPRSNRPPIRSTYVDVRKWSLSMWRQHPEVAEAAVKGGRPDLLADGALNSIFPKQTEVQSTPTSGSAAEKAKLAMESLVPIKFTSPNGESKIIDQNVLEQKFEVQPAQDKPVPDPVFPLKDFEIDTTKLQVEKTTPPSATPNKPEKGLKESLSSVVDQIFPKDFTFQAPNPKGLPKLQSPIPIFEGEDLSTQKNSNLQSKQPVIQKKEDLFTDVLRALIPQDEQASVQTPPPHSAAHPVFGIEAPAPSAPSENRKPQAPNWQLNRQNPIPFVKPF